MRNARLQRDAHGEPANVALTAVAQFDPRKMQVGHSGVVDLFWPISFDEVRTVRDRLTEALVDRYRSAVRDLTGADEELLMLGVWLILLELLTVFKAEALKQRCAEAGRRPEFPADWRVVGALVEGRTPRPSPLLDLLRRGPDTPSPLRLPLRLMRSIGVRDGIVRYPLGGFDPRQHIACISVGGLISGHARASRETVVFLRASTYFRNLTAASLPKVDPAMIRAVVGDVDQAFAPAGVRLSRESVAYLEGFLGELLGLLRLHLDGVLARPERVPERLWTTVGSTIWPRILRYAVRRHGGRITGHDHGMGGGHKAFRYKSLVEFECCDTYVTFTDGQVRALKELLEPRWLAQAHVPEIVALKGGAGAVAAVPKLPPRRQRSTGKMHTVMYATGIPAGEGTGVSPRLPDPIAIDWQARVLSQLRSWGYDVILKRHPAADAGPPREWLREIGVRQVDLPFEQVLHDADVTIFEAHQSTAFASAMLGGVATVVIDFGLDPIAPAARDAMARRCGIVTASFDTEGRAQVDWNELRATIERSRALDDDEFVRTYLLEGSE